MAKISINLLRWNNAWDDIERCISAVLSSDFQDFTLTYTENFNPDTESLVDTVRATFASETRLRIVVNDSNLGYAGGHNRFFLEAQTPFVMVLNPDAILAPDFLTHILRAFDDPRIGGATGKMLKSYTGANGEPILDGTGIEVFRSRRARERGQNDIDQGQFDQAFEVFGVSGTAAVYRQSALEAVRLGRDEYFDHDFFAYWEDLDLSWRLQTAGYRCIYVPKAIVVHDRVVGSHPGGLRDFAGFIRHHRSMSLKVRQWSWRNHLFTLIKNDRGWRFWRDAPIILCREVGLFAFSAVFIPRSLGAIPGFLRLLPQMLRKRREIHRSHCCGEPIPHFQ